MHKHAPALMGGLACWCRVQRVPSWQEEGGTFLAKRVLPVSWGADHRVLDGAALANFNEAWKHLLQNPHLMLMHLR